MSYIVQLVWLLTLAQPATLQAQQSKIPALPYELKLVKQEPEMGMGEPSFKPSRKTRGMKGLNGVVLWVSTDKKSLSAYEGARRLWKTNVATACSQFAGPHQISTVVSQSPVAVIFIFLDKNKIHAEIDRKTGEMSAIGIQLD